MYYQFDIFAVNELRAESATMIISTLLVRLASTDACPITIPPTIPTVRPTLVGKRAPLLSVIQSLFLKSASITGGKGTLLLDMINVSRSSLGISS